MPGILALVAVYVVIVLLLVKLLSGIDHSGHLPWSRCARIGMRVHGANGFALHLTAFKVAVFVAVLAGLAGVLAEQGDVIWLCRKC